MSRISFSSIAEQWLCTRSGQIKPTSLAAYSLIIQNHLSTCIHCVDDITSVNVQRMINRKSEKGLSRETLKGILVVLNQICKWYSAQGKTRIERLDVKIPQSCHSERNVLTLSEERDLLSTLAGSRSLLDIGIILCLHTGLRIGEVCALKKCDLNLKEGIIRISRTVHRIWRNDLTPHRSELTIGTPKTSISSREVPLTEDVVRILKRITADLCDDCFLLTGSTKPLEPQTIRVHYANTLATLGIPKQKFHGLRHTFATRCVESGCDIKTLSALLGHSNVSTTLNLYVHPSLSQKHRCIENMARLLENF